MKITEWVIGKEDMKEEKSLSIRTFQSFEIPGVLEKGSLF